MHRSRSASTPRAPARRRPRAQPRRRVHGGSPGGRHLQPDARRAAARHVVLLSPGAVLRRPGSGLRRHPASAEGQVHGPRPRPAREPQRRRLLPDPRVGRAVVRPGRTATVLVPLPVLHEGPAAHPEADHRRAGAQEEQERGQPRPRRALRRPLRRRPQSEVQRHDARRLRCTCRSRPRAWTRSKRPISPPCPTRRSPTSTPCCTTRPSVSPSRPARRPVSPLPTRPAFLSATPRPSSS